MNLVHVRFVLLFESRNRGLAGFGSAIDTIPYALINDMAHPPLPGVGGARVGFDLIRNQLPHPLGRPPNQIPTVSPYQTYVRLHTHTVRSTHTLAVWSRYCTLVRSRYACGTVEVCLWCGPGAVEVRSWCDRGTLVVRSRYARGTVEVRSWCGRGMVLVRSRYARGALPVHFQFGAFR